MLLKYKVEDINSVGEEFRNLYEPSDGGFKLKITIEDFVHKEQLNEFRNNNINLKKTNEELMKKIEEVSALAGKDVQEQVNQRVNSFKSETEAKITELSNALTHKNELVSTLLVDNQVRDAAIKAGVRKTAVDDIISRAKNIFTVDNDTVVAKRDGAVVYGQDTKPLSIESWMVETQKVAPHLFETSTGVNAPGSRATGNGVDYSKMSPSERIALSLEQKNTSII